MKISCEPANGIKERRVFSFLKRDLNKVLNRSVTVRYFVERKTKKIWVHFTAHRSLDTETIIRRAGVGGWLINVFNQRFVIPTT